MGAKLAVVVVILILFFSALSFWAGTASIWARTYTSISTQQIVANSFTRTSLCTVQGTEYRVPFDNMSWTETVSQVCVPPETITVTSSQVLTTTLTATRTVNATSTSSGERAFIPKPSYELACSDSIQRPRFDTLLYTEPPMDRFVFFLDSPNNTCSVLFPALYYKGWTVFQNGVEVKNLRFLNQTSSALVSGTYGLTWNVNYSGEMEVRLIYR